MARVFLQNIIEDLRFEDLPPNWNSFDLVSFSKSKRLWDYQQEAVKNAIKVLWKYFEDFVDYQEGEEIQLNQERKENFFKWYRDNGLEEDLSIKLDKRKRNIYNLLTEYYPQEDRKISYEHLINRMCFWMATGSGKTLIIIKLIQILKGLMERGEIPPHDILVLTYRDDLIEQLKKQVDEFNYVNEAKINLRELKDYPEVKRQRTFFGIPVFYYRSDNLSDVQKEKIIDFKNYDNDGKWYIFLDEAHKGDREESKRQHIYSILSRNGFLFNSSATFVDPKDFITCAFEFNLSSFINAGYGKHIAILRSEIKAFRDEDDYSGEEKQKIVLKSFLLLTYVKKFYGKIRKVDSTTYHNPMLLTLAHSVHKEDADLQLFFRELEKIGKGDIGGEVFDAALNELLEELKKEPELMFEEDSKIRIDEATFKNTTVEDVLRYIYNSTTSGEIEVLIRPSNRKELAFKLKTSERPFALIKIGDISGWLKEKLAGYEVSERFEDESYFENLNREDSEINILMGSRAFYEGWDSNRPNLINYINIGLGTDARKFILQSTGRGVRIEPVKDKRRRLLALYNAKEISEDLFNKIKDKVPPVETLFIFGTNRQALQTVISELEQEKKDEETIGSLFEVNIDARTHKLLVPTYKEAGFPILRSREQMKFSISEKDFETLKGYVEFIPEDRVFLMKYSTEPVKVQLLRGNVSKKSNFRLADKNFKNVDLLTQRIFDYYSIVPQEFEGLKELDEEIRHFQNIRVYLRDIREIQKKIEMVRNYPARAKELREQYGKISPEEYEKRSRTVTQEEGFETNYKKIKVKYVANHYYIPLILSVDEKVDYITHIIKTKSEADFINDLEAYLAAGDNKFKEFDWWFFSKLDETLDQVYIPYYNPNVNKISNFYPDFVFWLKKGDNYFILFVDPKGTEHTSAYRKIDGFKELFEENGQDRVFNDNRFSVKIKLLLRPEDISRTLTEYRRYWFDDIEKMLEGLL